MKQTRSAVQLRGTRTLAGALAAIIAIPMVANAATFRTLQYANQRQFTITCAAQLECTVTLQPGEHLNGGYSSDTTDWDTHLAYIGSAPNYTPEIIARPARAGLRTNFVITTNARTYYLYFVSTATSDPSYYVFATPRPAPLPRVVATVAYAAPTPSPLGNVDLAVACNGDQFYVSATSDVDASWRPAQVCTDGAHTYLQETISRDERTHVPVVKEVLGANHYGPVNYTYYADRARYVIDGVYPQLALVGGTSTSPWSITVQHASADAPMPSGMTLDPPAASAQRVPQPANVAARSANFASDTSVAVNDPSPVPTPAPTPSPNLRTIATVTSKPANDSTPAPSPTPRLIPIMDETGKIIAYTFTGAPAPSTSPLAMPSVLNNCPPPNASPGWDSSTAWSRDVRYATQGADAFVTAAAIKHGALSRGLFGFIKSPLGFIAGQALFDLVSDKANAHACPRVQNATNTLEALSAAVNALRSKP